jgi:anti-anti-sigma factor
VVQARGDVDIVTRPTLEIELSESLVPAPITLLIDLTEVDFLASDGLSALVELNNRCQVCGTALRIVTPTSVRNTIELAGLDDTLTLYGSRSDALLDLTAD